MELSQYFASQGCRLIEKNGRNVRYIAQCGHEHETKMFNFKRGSSRKCKDCVIKYMKESDCDYHIQEGESFLTISKILENNIDIRRTNEGCLADFIIRPIGISEDKWAQVQLKTTLKDIHGVYMFSIKRRYPNCIILCHCVSENRFWVFRDYQVPEKGLGIKPNGKYSQNEVLLCQLSDCLKDFYNSVNLVSCNEAMVPTSPAQIVEYQYRLKRETFFPHIHFEYPLYQHRRYDFIVDGKKYQEKVATRVTDSSYSFHSDYKLGENDFYFVHIPDSDYFYCIPEIQLIEHQNPSGRVTLNISKFREWYAPFRHNYTRVSFSF